MKNAILLLLICLANASAGTLSESQLKDIRFDQNIGRQVSLDLPFRDETGANVKLGDYFGHKPVILVPGYYGCPMLCTLVLNGLIGSLEDLRISVGNQFEVVNFSINPSETPALAAAKKRSYMRSYGRPGAEAGWKFLTGDQASIQKLADEIGFHYAYDSNIKQYAHPSGFVVLTPEGKISRYFFGVDYSAREIDTALTNASQEQTSSPVRQLFLLCFHYSPITGKYGNLIITTIRVLGIATVLWLGTLIVRSIARERVRPS
ncbi:MAG TPA: SCO family protein [Chthoniobacteraceae bacterium]|jgi:protein SCO1/2|nr:SCO family protein [Chthoniobacteraceae bacterium]